MASGIVNAVSTTFVGMISDRRFEASSYARNFLEERLKELKIKLEESEKELVAYAQQEEIINVDETQSLVSTNLSAVNTNLTEVIAKRIRTQQLMEQAESTDGLSLPQIMENEGVQNMRERRAELRAEYQNKLSFFKPAFPEMLNIKAQIDEIDRQIAAEVTLVKESIRADHESAVAQEGMLTAQLSDLKAQTLDLDERGIQYRILQREVDTNRQLYDGLLQRFKEVGVAGAVRTTMSPLWMPGRPAGRSVQAESFEEF